ncbi:MAG TPA: conjugal transfer protein [Porphyromonadaceae bacterium]|nr:conjugal transfer protein [Porphyromonadaceae bacterium]
MNIAYCFSAYIDPKHLRNLISTLHKDAEFFVHIDLKRDISEFVAEIHQSNVHFITDRYDIFWGEFSQCQYQLALIHSCLGLEKKFDYIFMLSGLDYPLWSNKRITKFLEENNGKQFIQAICLDGKEKSATHLYEMYRPFYDFPIKYRWLRTKLRIAGKRILNFFHAKRKKLYFYVKDKKWSVYKGAEWFAITPDLAKYILDTYETNPEIYEYFKSSFAPPETLFHTIAFNSHFADKCIFTRSKGTILAEITPLHFIDYSAGILVMQEKDFDRLIESGKMFCRKMRTGISDNLKYRIDKYREEQDML